MSPDDSGAAAVEWLETRADWQPFVPITYALINWRDDLDHCGTGKCLCWDIPTDSPRWQLYDPRTGPEPSAVGNPTY